MEIKVLGIYVTVLGGKCSWWRNKVGLKSSGKEPDNVTQKGKEREMGFVSPDMGTEVWKGVGKVSDYGTVMNQEKMQC